jgi:hypothetical protein
MFHVEHLYRLPPMLGAFAKNIELRHLTASLLQEVTETWICETAELWIHPLAHHVSLVGAPPGYSRTANCTIWAASREGGGASAASGCERLETRSVTFVRTGGDLRGVEKPGRFGAADGADQHAVGDAGDEVADVVRASERRHRFAVGLAWGAASEVFDIASVVVFFFGCAEDIAAGAFHYIAAAADGGVGLFGGLGYSFE